MSQKIAKNISTVIFDLGGVLFDIDYSLTQKAFIELGAKDFNTLYAHGKQAGVFDKFEKGDISPAEFRKQVKQWLHPKVSDVEIDRAWNALLIGFPHAKVQLLKKLCKRYRLFLLSNTNDIHLEEVIKMMAHLNNNGGIDSMFEKCYYSCHMHMRKPDEEIYLKVCSDNDLNLSTTLFIDDILQNVEGAAKAGINTFHYTGKISLEEYFG